MGWYNSRCSFLQEPVWVLCDPTDPTGLLSLELQHHSCCCIDKPVLQ